METVRHDWTVAEVLELLEAPLDELCLKAQSVHRRFADHDVQKCELLSIKTGGCADDCAYCSQSARHRTQVSPEPLMGLEDVIRVAEGAKARGASRLCMGAAWKKVPSGKQFARLLEIIRSVASLGLEVCGTFGSATDEQLGLMKQAGLTSYNHNLDTSRAYYPKIITTRSYDERLSNIRAIRKAGIKLCCGGILGLGETVKDRASLLAELASLQPHPESVPINMLVPVPGTPLEASRPVPFSDFLRVVATARILMPRSRVRLSAGRHLLSHDQQINCFDVGANSIFVGEKLLTTPNVSRESDEALCQKYEGNDC